MGTREQIRLLCAAAALLEGGPALALEEPQNPSSSEQADTAAGALDHGRDIVVFGRRDDGSIEGINQRDELDEGDIEAFGLDNVGEILDELSASVGRSGEAPVILVNGELVSSVGDIADLPPEALRRIQLLPPRAGVRYGAPRSRPVINIVVKRKFRQATVLAQGTGATAGAGRRANGELKWTAIAGPSRSNVALKVDGSDPLFEAERAIIGEPGLFPLSFSGIVLPQPLFGAEIDPELSRLAGRQVTVADVPPGTTAPSLQDFLATAGTATPGNLGEYRTLLPRTRRASINATFARRLSKRLTAQFYIRGDLSRSRSSNGVTEAFLSLPGGSPSSPFASDVTVARYIGPPLEQGVRAGNIDIGGTLNLRAGVWQATLGVHWVHGETSTRTGRGLDLAALQRAVAAGLVNPFGPLDDGLLGAMTVDPASRKRDRQSAQFNLTGPLFRLPAGPVTANINLTGSRERSFTVSSVRDVRSERRTGRDEGLVRGGLELPLLSSGADGKGALGGLSLSLAGVARKISGSGTYTGYGYGFDWRPAAAITIEGGYDSVQVPPTQLVLTDPVTVRDNVRVFDFLANQTVNVRYLTGGNPDLATERRGTWSFGARVDVAPRGRLQLTANWTRQTSRDAQSALPPPSAEVQIAFPDRYRRDGAGRLIEVDARAVSFARSRRDELSWGVSLRQHIGGGSLVKGVGEAGDDDDGSVNPAETRNGFRKGAGGMRINASVQHVWTLSSSRQARSGLPVVDLLAGGAAGYGGGQARHKVEFQAGLAAGGLGVQASGSWAGGSMIRAGTAPTAGDLRFSALTLVDLRVFADLGRVFGGGPVLKGTRLAVQVNNVLNRQTTVRDRSGAVPLSYQRYLLDPLGRTVSVSLRKKF